MAEMGLGYGSEFQLMRFLGHHRDYLNDLISKVINQSDAIEWKDYPFEKKKKSGDGEWKGIDCFGEDFPFKKEWSSFWPSKGNAMNWDGIFRVGKTWYFVEAKANADEAHQHCSAENENSIKMIDNAFAKTQKWLGICPKQSWRKSDCYQLANRLAFLYFCNVVCKIDARCLYISFINGYYRKYVESIKDWKTIWDEEYKTLGLNESNLKSLVYHIYPDCMQ